MKEGRLEYGRDGVLGLRYSGAPRLQCSFEGENEDDGDYENYFAAGIIPVWRA